jgi:hypothetical protein
MNRIRSISPIVTLHRSMQAALPLSDADVAGPVPRWACCLRAVCDTDRTKTRSTGCTEAARVWFFRVKTCSAAKNVYQQRRNFANGRPVGNIPTGTELFHVLRRGPTFTVEPYGLLPLRRPHAISGVNHPHHQRGRGITESSTTLVRTARHH